MVSVANISKIIKKVGKGYKKQHLKQKNTTPHII